MNAEELRRLESALGHTFSDTRAVLRALTHPSYGGDHHVEDYQRQEFLGDAALELAISDMLYRRFSSIPEGRLTRLRAELVREETLAALARDMQLGPMIRLSVGETRSGGADKSSILADVLEAVLAAVYLDGGYGALMHTVERLFKDRLDRISTDPLDAKSRLQEYCQHMGLGTPTYTLLSQAGQQHAPLFMVRVLVGDDIAGEGEGASKRLAQQAAAGAALVKLGAKQS